MWLGVDLRIVTNKTCLLKEIELHAHNMITISGSMINKFEEGMYDHLMSTSIFILQRKKIFMWALELKATDYGHALGNFF